MIIIPWIISVIMWNEMIAVVSVLEASPLQAVVRLILTCLVTPSLMTRERRHSKRARDGPRCVCSVLPFYGATNSINVTVSHERRRFACRRRNVHIQMTKERWIQTRVDLVDLCAHRGICDYTDELYFHIRRKIWLIGNLDGNLLVL